MRTLRAPISACYHAFVLRQFLLSLGLMTFVALCAGGFCRGAAAATVPAELRSYPLQGGTGSADISPDEKLVATESLSEEKTGNSEIIRFRPVVELWDFRANKLIARTALNEAQAPRTASSSALNALTRAQFIRFTGDGKLVAVYFDNEVRVLRASDLSEAGSMRLNPPPSKSLTYDLKRYGVQKVTYAPAIQGFEMSPTGRLLAILWVGQAVKGNSIQGRLDIYDISSRRLIDAWAVPNSWAPAGVGRDLAWGPVSKDIFIARANSTPCMSAGGAPDVLGINLQTEEPERTINTGLMVGDIAVTPSMQLLAVDANCVGLLSNHHPKMVVYDLRTGKHVRNVGVENSGVRYRISVSRDGRRAAAWTSDVKCMYDRLDATCYDELVSPMFTVWSLPDFRVVATSAVPPDLALPEGNPGDGAAVRISSTGRYVLVYRTKGYVFEVP